MEWRARWKASTKTGNQLFKGAIIDWNINQVALCFWSDFYDSIFEHPERPPHKIIENDDLLDKWVEDQTRKMENEAKKNSSGKYGSTSSATDHDQVITFENTNQEYIGQLDDYEER